jgi:hypothetical protein
LLFGDSVRPLGYLVAAESKVEIRLDIFATYRHVPESTEFGDQRPEIVFGQEVSILPYCRE